MHNGKMVQVTFGFSDTAVDDAKLSSAVSVVIANRIMSFYIVHKIYQT